MRSAGTFDREGAETALKVIEECAGILFESAPIMMHSIDRDGKILKVNRRWLEVLGYEADEVLGYHATHFLTEQSRVMVEEDQLSLSWRVGSPRSRGVSFVRKDGRVVDVLRDAETNETTESSLRALVALRDQHDLIQWKQASSTLKALHGLKRVQHKLENILLPNGYGEGELERPPHEEADLIHKEGLEREALSVLLETFQSISLNLRELAQVQWDWLHALVNQQTGLLLAVETIEITLTKLTETAIQIRSDG